MSLDPSLRMKNALAGTRTVMTRAERVAKLIEDKKLNPEKQPVLGLRKTPVTQS